MNNRILIRGKNMPMKKKKFDKFDEFVEGRCRQNQIPRGSYRQFVKRFIANLSNIFGIVLCAMSEEWCAVWGRCEIQFIEWFNMSMQRLSGEDYVKAAKKEVLD